MKKINAGTFQLIENWKFTLKDAITGEILSEETICNTVVNNGLERVAKLINGVSSTYYRAIAVGTDNTAVTNGDTALGTEVARELATLTYESDYKAKFAKTFSFSSGESYNIWEAGIFDSDTQTGSIMLARTVLGAAKAVNVNIQLIVEATITVARV